MGLFPNLFVWDRETIPRSELGPAQGPLPEALTRAEAPKAREREHETLRARVSTPNTGVISPFAAAVANFFLGVVRATTAREIPIIGPALAGRIKNVTPVSAAEVAQQKAERERERTAPLSPQASRVLETLSAGYQADIEALSAGRRLEEHVPERSTAPRTPEVEPSDEDFDGRAPRGMTEFD